MSGLSIGSLTTTILLALIVLYLLSLKQKERDTWYLIGYMGSLFTLIAAYTLRYSVYHPADVWIGQMANLVVFGGVCLVQFAYHYRERLGRREPEIVLVVSLVVAAVAWSADFFSAELPGVPNLGFLNVFLGYGMGVSLATLLAHLWCVAILIRKSRVFSHAVPGTSAADRDRSLRSTRNFALLFASTAAVAVTHLLYRIGAISRTSFVTIFNVGSLLIGLLIFVVYVNNSTRSVSFLTKLVGVSLATVLVSLGLAATALSPIVEDTISDYFAVKAEGAAAIASGAISGVGMDPDIGFVVNGEGEIIYSAESTPAGTLWRASADARSGSRSTREWGSRLTFLDQYDADSLYLTRKTIVSGEAFRVGIGYGAYRLVAHRFWVRLALVVVVTSAVIVAMFPVFLSRSLLLPIRRLIRAVEQVSVGNFSLTVPVVSEDETGQLSRAYNEMIDSLRQAEGNFQALAENANDAILLIADDGSILYANTRAQELTGTDARDLVGTPIGRIVPGAESGRLQHPADRVIVQNDGTSLPVEITGGQTEWHGQPAEVVIIRDLSERRAAEAVVRDQQQQIMQADKLASIGVLVAGVAHEIHNPNQVISLRAHVISEGLRDLFALVDDGGGVDESVRIGGLAYTEFKESAVRGVGEIRESTQRINKIVSELKGYVRSGGVSRSLTTEVNDAVQTVVNMCSHLIKSATDAFSVQLSSEPLTASMGKTELEQVILNLVQNACQALSNRSSAITVGTRAASDPGKVLITVVDEGTGMPEETLAKMFDPFFTTKRESGGTGLGLSVSRRLVKQAGGELRIESAMGKGTRATIELARA
ncbi:MAG: ATP-binding protein [Spirochaetia bacterium]